MTIINAMGSTVGGGGEKRKAGLRKHEEVEAAIRSLETLNEDLCSLLTSITGGCEVPSEDLEHLTLDSLGALLDNAPKEISTQITRAHNCIESIRKVLF